MADLATLTKDELLASAQRLKSRAQSLARQAEQGMEVTTLGAVGTAGAALAGAIEVYRPTVPGLPNVPSAPAAGLAALIAGALSKKQHALHFAAFGIGLSAPFVAAQTEKALRK
jgi:hypothetical protein